MKNNTMFRSVGIQFVSEDLSVRSKSKMLKNPTNNIDELKKIGNLLLSELLLDQELLVRRLGVKVSELTDIEGQSSITSYF